MYLNTRILKLERLAGTAASGPRCELCKDGTRSTGLIVTICGEEQIGGRRACPGCGRENPTFINILPALPPAGLVGSQP